MKVNTINVFNEQEYSSYKIINPQKIIDSINHQIQNKNEFKQQDIEQLCSIISNKKLNPRLRNDAIQAVESLAQDKKVPKAILYEIDKIINDKTDPINIIASKMFSQNKDFGIKLSRDTTNHTKLVSKEAVTVKHKSTFRSDILDINLNKKTNITQNKGIELSKKVNSQLEDLPDKGNNNKWYRSSLGEVKNILTMARNIQPLTKDDFSYLWTCLYRKNGQHEIARADPGVFETLKHITYNNKYKLPQSFLSTVEKVLKNDVYYKRADVKKLATQLANVYTFSTTHRYSLNGCKFQSEIYYQIREVAPLIIQSLAKNNQIISPELIEALDYSRKPININTGFHSPEVYLSNIETSSIKAISNIGLNQELPEKILIDLTEYLSNPEQVLPNVTSGISHVLAKKGYNIENQIPYLERYLSDFNIQTAEVFFSKAQNVVESSSWKKRYSWSDSNFQAVWTCFDFIQKKEELTNAELKYLSSQLSDSYTSNTDIIKNCFAIKCLEYTTFKGQILPEEILPTLEKFLNSKDFTMKEQISFILGCAVRNGQTISENSINSINKIIDDARIDVAYALGYHIEKKEQRLYLHL